MIRYIKGRHKGKLDGVRDLGADHVAGRADSPSGLCEAVPAVPQHVQVIADYVTDHGLDHVLVWQVASQIKVLFFHSPQFLPTLPSRGERVDVIHTRSIWSAIGVLDE